MEREGHPTGMRPSEVAKQLGLSVQSVYKYIKDGTIQAVEVPFGDERTTYVISDQAFKRQRNSSSLQKRIVCEEVNSMILRTTLHFINIFNRLIVSLRG